MMISSRQRLILERLCKEEKAIPLARIADELQVSVKTIQRELKQLGKICSKYNLTLQKQPGLGLLLLGDDQDKQKLIRELQESDLQDYTAKERKQIILCSLLAATEPVKLISLAFDLKVTPATISHDLDQLEDWLKYYQLEIIRRRGYGIEICGSEAAKRKAIRALLTEHLDEAALLSFMKEQIQQKSGHHTTLQASRHLLGLVQQENVQVVEKALEETLPILPFSLADSAYIGLVIHLSLVIERIRKGENIQFDPLYFQELKSTPEFHIAEQIVQRLQSCTGLSIPEDEIGYVTMHLQGAKHRLTQANISENQDIDLLILAKQFIHYCEQKLHVDLSRDESLLSGLLTHLEPAIHRIKKNMPIRNPLLHEIKQVYPEWFKLVTEAVQAVFSQYHVPEEEIGYLVMHIGAAFERIQVTQKQYRIMIVCSSGIGTSKMLASRIQKEIPNIKVLKQVSMFEVNDQDRDKYDAIISTVPLTSLTSDQYILVSPILTHEEISKIQLYLQKQSLQRARVKTDHPSKGINGLDQLQTLKRYVDFSHHFIQDFFYQSLQNQGLSKKEVLLSICDPLQEKNILTHSSSVVEQLLQREDLAGIGIPDTGIAFYHARGHHIQKVTCSLYHLSDPIQVKSMNGERMDISQIFLLLTPHLLPQEQLEIISEVSALLVEKETADVFLSADQNTIQSYLSEKLVQFCFAKQHKKEEI